MTVNLMPMVDEGLSLSRRRPSALLPWSRSRPFGLAPAGLIPGAARAQKTDPNDGAGTDAENLTHHRSAPSVPEGAWPTTN